jgi:hypothetical protein
VRREGGAVGCGEAAPHGTRTPDDEERVGLPRRTVPLAAATLLLAAFAAPAAGTVTAGAARASAGTGPAAGAGRSELTYGCPSRSDLLDGSPAARLHAAGGVTVTAWNGTDGRGHDVRVTAAQASVARVRLAVSVAPGFGAARRTTELTAGTRGAVVGVNGDYFGYDWSGAALPQGPLVRGGHVLRVPPGRSPVVGADATGRPLAVTAHVDGAVRFASSRLPVGSVNDDDRSDRSGADTVAAGRAVAVVTPWLGRARPLRSWEVVVRRGVVVAAGRRVAFGAGSAWGSGSGGRGDVLLAASGAAARALRALRPRTAVAVDYALRAADGTRLTEAVGSGAVMMRGGRDLARCDGPASVSRPRTLVAWDAARTRLWLVTVDGRGWDAPVSRYGLSYRQATEVVRALGATEAVMVDGGGSTTMALRGSGGVRRVDATENAPQRQVPDGLVLIPR